MNKFIDSLESELKALETKGNLRQLPHIRHEGREVVVNGQRMLNLSSNDYLGLASDRKLINDFLRTLRNEEVLFSSSSSRLLTGNFSIYEELEEQLASLYGAESALVFGSGYHTNSGILPAVANTRTLILADKLVHASLIDGIRLSAARCIRYRHNDTMQLRRLVDEHHKSYDYIIIVTESIFSMDGDEADLTALIELKHAYSNLILYLDEAHAFGVRGPHGLGCAEEQNCISEIDFLVGTLGKAAASSGAFVICRHEIRDFLINRARTYIYTTALPSINIQWTSFILSQLKNYESKRNHLSYISQKLRKILIESGYSCPSTSQIIPIVVGSSTDAILRAEEMQRKGFYVLPVRPPTVPEGTSRIRLSLTADVTEKEIDQLINAIRE